MRSLAKLPKPEVLAANEAIWLDEFLADPENSTKRYRYRHPQIKTTLRAETSNKCVYCESKLGHNTPGDVEHKVPSSKVPRRHFDWLNLTIACTECNRRKNSFYSDADGFLDPYTDAIEAHLEHHGPVVSWKQGDVRGEIFVSTLDLCSEQRTALIARKIEKLNQLVHLLERYAAETNDLLKGLLQRQVRDMASPASEYSAMIEDTLHRKGCGHLLG